MKNVQKGEKPMDNKFIFDCWYADVCQYEDTNECEKENCIRYLEMNYLMEHSNIPKSQRKPVRLQAPDCDYDCYLQLAEIKKDIQEFVEDGKSIYITSTETGNGKTTWAVKLLLKYFDTVWAGNGFRCRGLFIHTPTFLAKLKNFDVKDLDFEELKRKIVNVDLVVWDDIASTNLSNYDLSQLITYIDQRIFAEKANIYTGNIVEKSQLDKTLGARLSSRIYNASEVIEFYGRDRR